jgi:hypothetical protein
MPSLNPFHKRNHWKAGVWLSAFTRIFIQTLGTVSSL